VGATPSPGGEGRGEGEFLSFPPPTKTLVPTPIPPRNRNLNRSLRFSCSLQNESATRKSLQNPSKISSFHHIHEPRSGWAMTAFESTCITDRRCPSYKPVSFTPFRCSFSAAHSASDSCTPSTALYPVPVCSPSSVRIEALDLALL
jgi:hypothetical protein